MAEFDRRNAETERIAKLEKEGGAGGAIMRDLQLGDKVYLSMDEEVPEGLDAGKEIIRLGVKDYIVGKNNMYNFFSTYSP